MWVKYRRRRFQAQNIDLRLPRPPVQPVMKAYFVRLTRPPVPGEHGCLYKCKTGHFLTFCNNRDLPLLGLFI